LVTAQSDEQQPVHVFEKAGTYKVTLTVQDAVGSTSKEIITISVY
jgi:PKD repeat protein